MYFDFQGLEREGGTKGKKREYVRSWVDLSRD